MEMMVQAVVCGPCLSAGETAVAIRQFTVHLSAGWLGAAGDDRHADGVISVCATHAAQYDALLTKLEPLTDEALALAAMNAVEDDGDVRDDHDQDDDGDEFDADDDDEDDADDGDQDDDDDLDDDDDDDEPIRPVGGRARPAPKPQPATVEPKRDKAYNSALRRWGKDNGYTVPARGRISDDLHVSFKVAGYPGLNV